MVLSTRDKNRIVVQTVLALLVLLAFATVMNLIVGSAESLAVARTNLLAMVVVSIPLVLPHKAKYLLHFGIFTLIAALQIATDRVTEGHGHIFFLLSMLLMYRYGFAKKHGTLKFSLMVVLWLGALIVSGTGYIYQPVTVNDTTLQVRIPRGLAYIALYTCTAWMFYVIELRPMRQRLRRESERLTELEAIIKRYQKMMSEPVGFTKELPRVASTPLEIEMTKEILNKNPEGLLPPERTFMLQMLNQYDRHQARIYANLRELLN